MTSDCGRFSFFQAAAVIEALYGGKRPLGEALRPADEPVCFKVHPGFAFPPNDIDSLTFEEKIDRATMYISFLGLVGPSGVLPRWYNELALERNRIKDYALTDFLDIFHHRLATMFYLAWKKSVLTANYRQGGSDRFSRYFRCLIGLGVGREDNLAGLAHESLLHFAGLLSRQVPSTMAVESVVSYFSGEKASVDQFVERSIDLPPEDLTRLGGTNASLGVDAVCGSQVTDCMSKFRINLGPMTQGAFKSFLPGGHRLHLIFALVRFMVGIEYEFEIRLLLKRDQVAPCSLGGSGSAFPPRLGWSTWIKASGSALEEDPGVTFQYGEGVAA